MNDQQAQELTPAERERALTAYVNAADVRFRMCEHTDEQHEAFMAGWAARGPVQVERPDEAAIERGAKAGQALAVHWGHQPWSDSWARLVAETILAGETASAAALDVIEGLFLAGTDMPMGEVETDQLIERAERVLVANGRKLPHVPRPARLPEQPDEEQPTSRMIRKALDAAEQGENGLPYVAVPARVGGKGGTDADEEAEAAAKNWAWMEGILDAALAAARLPEQPDERITDALDDLHFAVSRFLIARDADAMAELEDAHVRATAARALAARPIVPER